MKNYYTVREQNLNEIYIDNLKLLNELKENNSIKAKCRSLGKFDTYIEKKRNIYLSQLDFNFNKNIQIIEDSQPSIALYFSLEGYSYQKLSIQDKEFFKFPQNHCGLFFVQGNNKDTSLFIKNTPSKFIGFHFMLNFFEQLVQWYPHIMQSSLTRFKNGESFILNGKTGPISTEMQHLLHQIQSCNLMGNYSNMYLETKILELLALQFQGEDAASYTSCQYIKTHNDRDKINEVKSILISHLSNTPSIREISQKVGMNEDKLKKGFKEVFGTTIFGYLFEYKMQLAKQYLLDTSLSVGEIALHCGYEYPSHFSTAFKRYYGCTPLEMRKRS